MRLASKQNEAICGYYCMACAKAGFTAEDTRKGLTVLEELLLEYKPEVAREIYTMLMGRNPALEDYMQRVCGKEE